MQRPFHTFLGVDLGSGKGKTTALVRLRLLEGKKRALSVEECASGKQCFDGPLLALIEAHKQGAVLAVDAPLTLPVCVRCVLPVCPGLASCEVETVRFFREHADAEPAHKSPKPRFTPYTQRATEILLHKTLSVVPLETLGQGMGPLTARAQYLRNALKNSFRLHENLIEVYPKATLVQLFPDVHAKKAPDAVRYRDAQGQEVDVKGRPLFSVPRVARTYKRSGHARDVRQEILSALSELTFSVGLWRETVIENDHLFDAMLCAYTGYLWAKEGWSIPAQPLLRMFLEDGYIFVPPKQATPK